jgi:hypothetical protein
VSSDLLHSKEISIAVVFYGPGIIGRERILFT